MKSIACFAAALLLSAQDYPLSEWNSNLYADVKKDNFNEWWLYNEDILELRSNSNPRVCLDAYPKDGKYWVHTWECDGANPNQRWHVDMANHRIQHATHPNVCLDADPTAPEHQVQVWECHSHDVNKNQYWSVVQEVGYLHRKGLFLTNTQRNDIEGDISFAPLLPEDAENPFPNEWHQDHTNENQKWQYDVYTNQLRHFKHNGYCLDINDETGARPHLWQCHPPTHNFYSFQTFDLFQTSSSFN
ncbi:hypothetical protein H257_19253 [Aphanomyces astaci]|uniref:Ricin B lectin domain-containing protein n=1 Tax=Aphanomyces astaci TaxID=112090 RepID=W4F8K8_APHAT|nr:hypothetical protein H257_19253 [Aphanomyces astaci]ETV63815.1 hypothetical protein H257_19253 [Aphanomyces astaci]|eukprot:XP_009846702.1 hypothetical protein H257_19253 [Aphanomyces astaci]